MLMFIQMAVVAKCVEMNFRSNDFKLVGLLISSGLVIAAININKKLEA